MVDMLNAQNVYLHLVECAMNGTTTSYRQIADYLLVKEPSEKVYDPDTNSMTHGIGSEGITEALDSISDWLKEHHLPMLTSLVVRESGGSAGKAGSGFWKSLGWEDLDHTNTELTDVVLNVLQRQCFDYYQGISVNNTELRQKVFDLINELYDTNDSERIREMNYYHGKMLQAKRNVPTRHICRNAAVVVEPVDINVQMFRWFQGETKK